MRYSLHALYLKSKYFAIHFKHRHIMWQSDRRTYIKVSTKKQISLEKSLPFDTLARERITRRGSNPINASLYLTTQTECLLFKQHPNDFIHTARDLWSSQNLLARYLRLTTLKWWGSCPHRWWYIDLVTLFTHFIYYVD